MFTNLKLIAILLVSMLLLSGCGDLLGKKVPKRELDSSFASANCNLNVSNFTEIMNKDISSDIRCLGENLKIAIKIFTSGKPGSISRDQLENYLRKRRKDVSPEVIEALGAVFHIGHLITGEDANYISKETVEKVLEFALVFNQQASQHYGPIFKSDAPVGYNLHVIQRKRVEEASLPVIESLRKVFNKNRNGQIHKLNIPELLQSFTTDSNRKDIEKLKKFLFLKRVLIGGKYDEITHLELEKVIYNFGFFLKVGLDIARYDQMSFKQNETLQLLKTAVDETYDFIYKDDVSRDKELFFYFEEAMTAAKVVLEDEDFDVEKYRDLILEFKKLTMTGGPKEIKGGELKNLFTHARKVLKTGVGFHQIYERFKPHLEQPLEVTIDFSEYQHTYPDLKEELKHFERIVKKYRFMKGEFISSFYTREIRRNANAVFEIFGIEYVLKIIFNTYGKTSKGSLYDLAIDKKLFEDLMKKFEKELIELDLILPQRAITTANNISLLGSLFQYQSDTNELMDINEATEFALTVFSSLNIADDILAFMDKKECIGDDDRVKPECFRNNFWEGLCASYRDPDMTDSRKQNDYFPLLFQSLNAPKKCSEWKNTKMSADLLDRAIRAGRACMNYTDGNKEEIPYTKSDIMTLMVVLLHTETTILRWDTNKNNYMDANEVMNAYSIYSSALAGFLKDKNPIIQKFQKQIYQYMIMYEKVPDEKDFGSIWQFIKFLVSFNKSAPAYRKTIASLLVAIGEQNAKLQTGPQFDCNLLRNPKDLKDLKLSSGPVEKSFDYRPDYSEELLPYLHLTK